MASNASNAHDREDANLFCTFAATGSHKALQEIYICRTCGTKNDDSSSSTAVACVCQACAQSCHANHEGLEYVGVGESYCDCSKLSCCCQLQDVSKQKADDMGIPVDGLVSQALQARNEDYIQEVYHISALNKKENTDRLVRQAVELIKHTKDTHWVSFEDLELTGADWCELERLAYFVLKRHAMYFELKDCNKTGGAEWWVQVKTTSFPSNKSDPLNNNSPTKVEEAVDLHYDKDEDLAETFGLGSFPTISTVTYLTCPPSAAPTLVFPRTYNQDEDDVIDEMLVSHARRGKHLVFDGRLLHGAPGNHALRPRIATTDENNNESLELRVTFLVNIWQRRPLGVRSLCSEIRQRVMEAAVGGSFVAESKDMTWATSDLLLQRRCIENVKLTDENELPASRNGRMELPFVSRGASWMGDEQGSSGLVLVTFPPPPHKSDTIRTKFGPGLQAYLDYEQDDDSVKDEHEHESHSPECYV